MKIFNKGIIESLVLISTFVFGCIIGTYYSPGPIAWDDLLYMHTAWNATADTTIMNRYFIVYLLMFFNILARGDPFLGVRMAGAFIFTCTILTIYLNARTLAPSNKALYGSLAVLFMLAYPKFAVFWGVMFPDFVVTMFIMIGVYIYLLYHRSSRFYRAFLFLYGLVFFMAVRSKETGLILVFLVPGFLLQNELLTVDHSFSALATQRWKAFLRQAFPRLGVVLAGFIFGIGLFIFLNAWVLKSPWFGWRPADFLTLFAFNTREADAVRDAQNFFVPFGSSVPFIMAIIAIFKFRNIPRSYFRILYLLPLGLVIFLNFTLIRGAWDVVVRYIIPGLAVTSILAPLSISEDIDKISSSQPYTKWVYVLGSFSLSLIISFLLYRIAARGTDWEWNNFANAIIGPMALCIWIAWAILSKSGSRFSLIFSLVCIGMMTLPSFFHSTYTIYTGAARVASVNRFKPFAVFQNDIKVCPTGKVFISTTIHYSDESRPLSRDALSSLWMFDLYFRCHSNLEQFEFSKPGPETLEVGYQYLFLHRRDLDNSTIVLTPEVQRDYILAAESEQKIFLLISTK